jgi:hypothetical protein
MSKFNIGQRVKSAQTGIRGTVHDVYNETYGDRYIVSWDMFPFPQFDPYIYQYHPKALIPIDADD